MSKPMAIFQAVLVILQKQPVVCTHKINNHSQVINFCCPGRQGGSQEWLQESLKQKCHLLEL